jgi:hypothetical protein
MTMIGKPALSLLLVALALLAPSQASAICWVGQVKLTAIGIDIYFSSDRTVTLQRAGQKPRMFQTYSAKTTHIYQHPDAMVVEAVPAVLGDRLFSNNSPHDGCSMTVAIRDGRIGLDAQAFAQLGPYPPTGAEKFMPAEE